MGETDVRHRNDGPGGCVSWEEHVEAIEHLRRLADWGWGEHAPELAISDWEKARYFLGDTGHPSRDNLAALRVGRTAESRERVRMWTARM